MADDVDMKIKLDADLSGGVQTREELQRIKSKAHDLEMGMKSSAKGALGAIKGLEQSVGFLRKAMTGFGVVGLVSAAIASIRQISLSFDAARAKAEEFRKVAEAKALADSVRDLADAYGEMKSAIAAAAQVEQNQLEIIDREVKARRELAAAKLDAAEQAELAAINGDSETAAEQRSVVAAKYAKLRGNEASSNRVEDLQLERQKQETAAARADKEASAAADNALALRRKAKEILGKAAIEGIESTAPNAKDKTGVLGYLGGQVRDLFSGNWGNLTNWQTAEGDEEREAHRKNKEALEDQAATLEKQAKEADAEAMTKREEAAQNRRRNAATDVLLEAAALAQRTTEAKGIAGEASASDALADKEYDLARARSTLGAAPASEKSLRRKEQVAREAYASVESNWVREQREANDAQLAYDHVRNTGGSRRDLEAAYAKLQQEQREAENARYKMEAAAASLATTLKGINESLNALSKSVNQAKSRLATAKEETS